MPYIDKETKEKLLESGKITSPGELNYVFTQMIKNYIINKGESYQTYNDIMGALEGAKLELYRRQIASYEDIKIQQNGDVYSKRGDI